MICPCGQHEARQPCGLCKRCYGRKWRRDNIERMRAYWRRQWKANRQKKATVSITMPDEAPLEIFLRAFDMEPKELAKYILELRERNEEPQAVQTRQRALKREHHYTKSA